VELFGVFCSMPAAFVASAIYFGFLRVLIKRVPVERILIVGACALLGALFAEWALLATLGAVRSRAAIGPVFYPVHLALFMLGVPALATILTIKTRGTRFDSWLVVAFASGLFALPVALTQYVVSEALYGIDGEGGPFGRQ
jgi:hypothetical protein